MPIGNQNNHQTGHLGMEAEIDKLKEEKVNQRREAKVRAKDGTLLEDLAVHHRPRREQPQVQFGQDGPHPSGEGQTEHLLAQKKVRVLSSLLSLSLVYLLS